MTLIDLTLLVILGGFVLAGFWFGLIHMAGTLVGLIVGPILAGRFYLPFAAWLDTFVDWNENLLRVIAFILLFTIVNRAIGLVVLFAEKAYKIIAVIPFMTTFNRLLGAALGLIEGVFVLGLAVYVMARYPFTAEFGAKLAASAFAVTLNTIGSILAPLLPAALRALQSVI